MTQPKINTQYVAAQLKMAIRRKGLTYKKLSKLSGVEASRISKFCGAHFKRMTPVLKKLCKQLDVKLENEASKSSKGVAEEICKSVRLLIAKSPKKAESIRQLIQSVNRLVAN